MGLRSFSDKYRSQQFTYTARMLATSFIVLLVGFHCVVGEELSEEKRWGAAASNSVASNSNNINLGKKAEDKRWWGDAGSNSKAGNSNNIRIGKKEEEKRWWGD